MHVTDPRAVRRLAAEVPALYVLFDVLSLDGEDLTPLPYRQHRRRLEELTLAGPFWQVTPSHEGEGAAMLEVARRNRLEGLVAKRLDSPYEPGRRSPNWVKIKLTSRDEFVVGGWVPEHGDKERVGALLVGYYDCEGGLHYAGAVGSGLAVSDQRALADALAGLTTSRNPFADRSALPPGRARAARWVRPVLVAEVEYRRWPQGGLLQQSAYKGLRTDKPAEEVIRPA